MAPAPPSPGIRLRQWYSTLRSIPNSCARADTLSQVLIRYTAICRNDFGYRPTLRFFATRSPFPCKVCQLRVSHLEGSVQAGRDFSKIAIRGLGWLMPDQSPYVGTAPDFR